MTMRLLEMKHLSVRTLIGLSWVKIEILRMIYFETKKVYPWPASVMSKIRQKITPCMKNSLKQEIRIKYMA